MSIHSSAIVSEDAVVGTGVTVGPFAIIESGATIGDDCVIDAAAQVRSRCVIGKACHIGSGAIIGADPHYHGFDPATESGVRLGDGNVIREYVTIHRSIESGGETVLGAENFLMNAAHLGHDSRLGDHNTLANNVLLGGHVVMGDHCFLGGGSVFHQFVRLGDRVMVQGLGGFSLDLPHFVMAAGINEVAGLNSVGLRRGGIGTAARSEIKSAFREIYQGSRTLSEVLEEADGKELQPETKAFFDFFREESKKGVCKRFRGRHTDS